MKQSEHELINIVIDRTKQGKENIPRASFLDKKRLAIRQSQIKVPSIKQNIVNGEDSVIVLDESDQNVSELYED